MEIVKNSNVKHLKVLDNSMQSLKELLEELILDLSDKEGELKVRTAVLSLELENGIAHIQLTGMTGIEAIGLLEATKSSIVMECAFPFDDD